MSFNNSQLQAIQHFKGPALVLAGPGSGKTLVITQRTKYLIEQYQVNPSEILVITFTKAAANEMQQRFCKLMRGKKASVTFGTFHGVYFKILKYAYGLSGQNIISEDQKTELLKGIIEKLSVDTEDQTEFLSSVISEISLVKGEKKEITQYISGNVGEKLFRTIYQKYEEKLRALRKIDFDDMLVMTYELLTQRKDILSAWQRKYRYILIDETQDCNQIQYDVIRLLAEPENNLFVVGDDDQSIYSFRGARPEIMMNFTNDFPDAVKIVLDWNYRSTKQIVKHALKVVEHNKKRFSKKIQTNNPEGTPIEICCYANPAKENEAIISHILHYLEQGYSYSDMAVLFRTNTEPRPLIERLIEFNLPFYIKDTIPNLYKHWISQNIISYVRIAMGSRERSEFLKIINRPKRYISRDCLDTPEISFDRLMTFYEEKRWMMDRISQMEADLHFLRNLSPFAGISYIRKGIGYEDFLIEYAEQHKIKPEELFLILDELQESAEGFHTYEEWLSNMEEYEKELELQEKQKDKNRDVIQLLTYHSSKGLEYPIVFLINANEGVTPYHKATMEEELEEERRMFYVAMTRAKERLHIYCVKERYGKPTLLSRFVEEMELPVNNLEGERK